MSQSHAERSAARANRFFRFLRFLGRALFRALFAVEVEGLERLPQKGGYILACNHLCWIDPLILLAYLPPEPRIHFMAAIEYTVEGPWLVRQIVRRAGGVIPVDRHTNRGLKSVVVQSLRVLRGDGVLGIFPEGRCGTVEGQIQPLKEGAAALADRTGCPVLVCGISGTSELFFRKRIRLRIGPVLQPRDWESAEELLERLAGAMAETIPPVHPDQPRVKRMTWLNRLF